MCLFKKKTINTIFRGYEIKYYGYHPTDSTLMMCIVFFFAYFKVI